MFHDVHFSDEYVQSVQEYSDKEDLSEQPYSDVEKPLYVPQWIVPYVNHARALKQLTPADEEHAVGESDAVGDTSGS